MAAQPAFYLTTPIYYVNDRPHIGHAYTSLACDVLARFMRLDGYDVLFLTGTDEHGQKVEKSARAAGEDPKAFCDKMSGNFRELGKLLNLSNDAFIRTTEPRHIKASQAIWRAIAANKSPKGRDNIYLAKYPGWYAVRDEAFYAESELTTGPDGKKRAPSGAEVEWVEEPSYFFRLSDWSERLLELYREQPELIGPATRRNEVISFVEQGLTDLSISRTTFAWGVPVPDAPSHIMYVWLDALTNYLTAVDYPNAKSEAFSTYWPTVFHMVGKDILRFHAVYWPAFLMAAGIATPKRIFAHGWLLNKGEKMSKSLGNVVRPAELIAQYGLDPVRYYLMREVPFGSDGYISHETMVARINGDLANDFGNLAQRVLTLVQRNCRGTVPTSGEFTAHDRNLLDAALALLEEVRGQMREQAFHRALEAIWRVVSLANRYVDENAPWALAKTDQKRMATVLYVLAEAIRHLAILASPFMPASCARLLDLLAVPVDARDFKALQARPLKEGTVIAQARGHLSPLCGACDFPRKRGRFLMLVDSHCHLDFPDFAPERDAVVARARAAGVATMVTISTKLTGFPAVRAIAETYPEIWCSVGVHPHEAAVEEGADEPQQLAALAAQPRVIGIGETGLDYYYEHSPREAQKRAFRAHCAAARATRLPLIVHSRDADEDMAEILAEESQDGALRGLLHCFSSGAALARRALELGFFISISGIVTFKAAEPLRAILRGLPLDRLLVETDAPYLAPVPLRGKRNEPAFVVHTAAAVAALKGVSREALAEATTANFFRLFNKASKPVMTESLPST